MKKIISLSCALFILISTLTCCGKNNENTLKVEYSEITLNTIDFINTSKTLKPGMKMQDILDFDKNAYNISLPKEIPYECLISENKYINEKRV